MRNVTTDRSYVLQSNPRLLDATLDEFASRDFEAASLNEILKQSGFNKGSFYYRFADKYELYAALLETVFARHAELLDKDYRSIVDTRGVATGLAAMISSLYRLGNLDHRYLALYARLYDELATVHPNLKLILSNSPIERLIHSLRSLLSESSPSCESTRVFGNLAQMTLYHLDRVARIDGVWTEPMKIAQAMIHSAYEGENAELEPVIKFGTVDYDTMGGQTPTDDVDFAISSGEIVALVGRDPGKSNLGNLINGVLGPRSDDGRVFSPTLVELGSKGTAMIPAGIKSNRTLRWHLRQAGINPGSDREAAFLTELGLDEVPDIRLDRLRDAIKTKTEFACLFASDAKVLVIDRAIEGLNPDDRERISRMLLKRKRIGNTIILCTSLIDEALFIADRIAFIVKGNAVRIASTEELRSLYAQKMIVVDYLEGGLAHRTRFPLESLSKPEFRDFIVTNKILGIETRAMTGAEIFKMETGAELS